MKYKISLLIFALFLSQLAVAKTMYVTDIFKVTLRSGQSTKNDIIRMLPSGTALEVLEADKASGYTKVRTPSGKEGWILTRYLMATPSARARIASAENKLANYEKNLSSTQKEFQSLTETKASLEAERKQLSEQNKKLSRELSTIKETASNAINLSSENQRLKKQMADTAREIQFLQQENASLQDRSNRDWFMVGALVVVASMIFGIILTRIRWKKKESWGDL